KKRAKQNDSAGSCIEKGDTVTSVDLETVEVTLVNLNPFKPIWVPHDLTFLIDATQKYRMWNGNTAAIHFCICLDVSNAYSYRGSTSSTAVQYRILSTLTPVALLLPTLHLDRFTHNYGSDDLNGHLERKGLERRGRKNRARNECKETSHRCLEEWTPQDKNRCFEEIMPQQNCTSICNTNCFFITTHSSCSIVDGHKLWRASCAVGAAGAFGPNHVLRDSLPVVPFALSQYEDEELLWIMAYPLENETDPRRLAREVIRAMMGTT
ncbi:13652_t:CDS:2, partial [Acaulospora colombiana]